MNFSFTAFNSRQPILRYVSLWMQNFKLGVNTWQTVLLVSRQNSLD
jgi:hypothetical protein